jgi:membrane protease YdiL (CAAX protease family)
LACYFLLAFTFTWTWEVLALVVFHLPLLLVLIPGPFVGPTLCAFIMIAQTSGKAGVLRLLRRYILWRVSLQWYLFVLIGMPVLILLSVVVLPGALAAFHAPTLAFVLSYLVLYLQIFLGGGPLGEEPGWRGFALPRLQQRFGALVGTLVLGVLHGLWHLPLFLFIPGYNGAGAGFLGIGIPFVEFVVGVTATTVIFTWVFNNAHGSLLLVMLLHASINTASGTLLQLFPDLAASQLVHLSPSLVFVVVALLILVATRGRLSYERNQRSDILPATEPR